MRRNRSIYPTTDQMPFCREAMAVSEALNRYVRPVKMNYEIHGNTLPHLQMHLLPRQLDDAFVGRPIDMNSSTTDTPTQR